MIGLKEDFSLFSCPAPSYYSYVHRIPRKSSNFLFGIYGSVEFV